MTRGIVIPILARYENILVHNLHNLFNRLDCDLPIELWQIGHEISIKASNVIMELRDKQSKDAGYVLGNNLDHALVALNTINMN